MELIVFTDNESLSNLFNNTYLGNEEINVTVYSMIELDGRLNNSNGEKYFYIDVSKLKLKEINGLMNKIQNHNLNIGFIDPKGKVKDPADLMFSGLFDYMGRGVIKKILQSGQIDISRIKSAINFHKNHLVSSNLTGNEVMVKEEFGFCSNWKEVKEGKEYLFWILFIGIDNVDWIKESISAGYRKYLFTKFKEYVKRSVKGSNGRIWIWNEHGGVVLFPYDGISIDAVASSIRLTLNRRIFSFELKDSFDFRYRIALHKGKTIYKERGKTGTIISDDINKVFHLGLDFAEESGFYITDAAMELLPEKAAYAFEDLGVYEGLRIFKFYDFVR